MGQSLSSTAFVGVDHRPAAQSYRPCHLFGDADIYGLGIRLSFYLQYFAAIVALFIGVTRGLKNIRVGLAIVAIAMFIALCVNSTGKSLVFLDWYIVIALALSYVFLTDIFVRVVAWRVYITRRIYKNQKDLIRARGMVRVGIDDAHRDHQVELIKSTIAVHRGYFVLQGAAEAHALHLDERRALHQALDEFVAAVQASDHARAVYTHLHIIELTASINSFNLEEFHDEFIAAALDYHMSREEAEKAYTRAQKLAKIDYEMGDVHDALEEIKEEVQTEEPLSQLTTAIICISWAAYQFVRPWLYWVGVSRGEKLGCDVKVLWFFVPISIYRQGFITFLKIWGILFVILGAAALLYGLWLLFTNLFAISRWPDAPHKDSEVESQRGLLADEEPSGDTRAASPGKRRASQERERERKQTVSVVRESKNRKKRKFYRVAAFVQLLALAITIGVVEGTIAINNLDMSKPAFGSSSQLIAFLVGLLTALPVFWECFVIVPLKWLKKRRGPKKHQDKTPVRHEPQEKAPATYEPPATSHRG